MKDKCSIARDLMPLVIDGACSEESSSFVKEHVSQCPPCAEVWGEMKTELPRMAAEKEKAELEKAARAMKKKRRKRVFWTALLSVMAAVVLVFGGGWLYDELTVYTHVPMSKDEVDVKLYKTSDGTGLIVFDLARDDAVCGQGWGYGSNNIADLWMYEPYIQLGDERYENLHGGYHVYEQGHWTEDGWFYNVDAYEVSVALSQGESMADGPTAVFDTGAQKDVTYSIIEPEYVQEIWMNYSDGRELLYTHGDEVPTCSPEMEAYLQCLHTPLGKGKYGMEYDYDKLAELRAAVPEWQ